MRDRPPDNKIDPNSNIIVYLHSTEGTHWVLVIKEKVVLCIILIVLVLRPHHYF